VKDERPIRWLAWAALLALPGGILAWARRPAAHASTPSVASLPADQFDRGIACLASGVVQPSLSELSEADLRAVAGIIGRLLHSYENGAFESFLALRASDLEFAAEARAGDLWQAREFVRELGNQEPDLEECGWVETMRRYWASYYAEPPVASFLLERSAVRLHREGLGARSLEDWQHSFEALRDREPGPTIQHELVIPHRREIERVARDSGRLQWLDLELPFEARPGGGGRLVTRFVWDAANHEWFLHAAATVYANGARVERHLIL
jgi:hypothetical protein